MYFSGNIMTFHFITFIEVFLQGLLCNFVLSKYSYFFGLLELFNFILQGPFRSYELFYLPWHESGQSLDLNLSRFLVVKLILVSLLIRSHFRFVKSFR